MSKKQVKLAAMKALEIPPQAIKQHGIICDGKGKPKSILHNAVAVIQSLKPDGFNHPIAESVGWCELRRSVYRLGPVPWLEVDGQQWGDHDSDCLAAWLQTYEIDLAPDMAFRALAMNARARPFHPVRDYIRSLEWDKKPRLATWLTSYIGADDNQVNRAIGEKFLLQALDRVFQPGCKADHVLILEGDQGRKKSSAVSLLAGEWFSDQLPPMHSKDSSLSLGGVWIMEIAELESLTNSQAESIKGFLSRTTERYRPPYGRHPVNEPRQTVFVGTTNLSQYLHDPTGGRRFWPVEVGDIDLEALARDRDQLWAEAFARYQQDDSRHWFDEDDPVLAMVREEQAARIESDPWEEPILEYIAGATFVKAGQVLEGAIKKDRSHWTKIDQDRVGAILRKFGWVHKTGRTRGGRAVKAFWPPRNDRQGELDL